MSKKRSNEHREMLLYVVLLLYISVLEHLRCTSSQVFVVFRSLKKNIYVDVNMV